MIKKYITLSSSNPHTITEQMNERIKEGFEPYGSMVATDGTFAQQMVKYEPDPDITAPENVLIHEGIG